MKRSNRNEDPWRAAGLVGVIGIDVALCTLLGYWGGAFLSARAGGEGWLIAGVLFGLFAGIGNVAFLIKRFLEDTNE